MLMHMKTVQAWHQSLKRRNENQAMRRFTHKDLTDGGARPRSLGAVHGHGKFAAQGHLCATYTGTEQKNSKRNTHGYPF